MDPSGLLTILGLAVAAFAIIPKESRLDLSLRISIYDWIVIFSCLILVHYIIYFPVLKELGLSLSLGNWRWGFNESNTTYLIFLFLTIYIVIRIKIAKLTYSNIDGFSDFFERLILENKYGELSILVERHLSDIVKIKNNIGLRNKIAEELRTTTPFDEFFEKAKKKDGVIKRYFPNQMNMLATAINKHNDQQDIASSIIRRLLNSPEFIRYLSISKPYLCLYILSQKFGFKDDFLKLYIYNLIDNPGSAYYYELEHTQNLIGHNRYGIEKENKFLYYFFKDVNISQELAIYKPVGDKVCEIIDYDLKLIQRYNEPLGIYYEGQRSRCPIDSSLHFFETMILESMHQGIKWHMWLYYFSTFTNKIINKLNSDSSVDLQLEWPTPFHYLLYKIVTIILDWLDEYQYVENRENLKLENESLNHDNGSIPKSAALALGDIVFMIVSSNKISDEFKKYIIEIVMIFLRDNQCVEDIKPISRVLMKSILLKGFHKKSDYDYLNEFNGLYKRIDHTIIYELNEFNELLETSIKDSL